MVKALDRPGALHDEVLVNINDHCAPQKSRLYRTCLHRFCQLTLQAILSGVMGEYTLGDLSMRLRQRLVLSLGEL